MIWVHILYLKQVECLLIRREKYLYHKNFTRKILNVAIEPNRTNYLNMHRIRQFALEPIFLTFFSMINNGPHFKCWGSISTCPGRKRQIFSSSSFFLFSPSQIPNQIQWWKIHFWGPICLEWITLCSIECWWLSFLNFFGGSKEASGTFLRFWGCL